MKWVGLILIASIWGPASAIFFFKSWISFLGILASLVGLWRGRVSRGVVAGHLFHHLTQTMFFGLGLLVGFLLLYQVLPFGRTQGEIIIYWISAMVTEVMLLGKISIYIDEIWHQVNGPDEEN